MNKNDKKLLGILFRYVLIVLAGLGNLWLIYKLMTPLTVYTSGYLLSFFYSVEVMGTTLIISSLKFSIVKACVAGAAYYLLLALALSTRTSTWRKYIQLILISWGMLLIFNVIRIMSMVIISVNGSNYFDVIHKIFWYGLSIVFVLITWFLSVHILKIKSIPVYSDFKYIISKIKKSPKKKTTSKVRNKKKHSIKKK